MVEAGPGGPHPGARLRAATYSAAPCLTASLVRATLGLNSARGSEYSSRWGGFPRAARKAPWVATARAGARAGPARQEVGDAVIEIDGLYKYYGERRAVGPLTARIESGEVIGLLGLNGAGKTTTLRVLACDLLPSGGTVRIDGEDLVGAPERVKARIGYLPDRPPLYDDLRVGEYLAYAARLRGVPASRVSGAVADVEARVGLGAVSRQLVGTLSHGYRQRLGIAQAIVHHPSLVVLDEPISGLDPSQIVEMRGLIRALGGEHTVVLSSHILTEVSETCDRLLVLRDGVIVASGTESELGARFQGAQRSRLVVGGGTAPSAIAEALRGVRGVTRVERPEAAAADGMVFHVDSEVDVRGALARAVIEAGGELRELLREHRDLENVFLRLAGLGPAAPPSNAGTTEAA